MTEVLSKEIWERVTDLTLSMLKEKGFHYDFNPPKYDGSHVKMKGSFGLSFAFALNDREAWVELEIKAKNGQPQESVYNQIHAKSVEIEKKLGYEIRWNKEDLIISSRRKTGGDYRIKTVMPFSLNDIRSGESNIVESWAERMVLFIQAFSPFLPGKGPHRELKSERNNTRSAENSLVQGEILTRDEIQAIYRKIAKPWEEIPINLLKEAIEKECAKQGRKLRIDWWEITEKNLVAWSKKG